MRWGKPQSLYAQLLLFLGLPLVLLWGLSAFNSYVSALQAATQAYDRTLLSSARTVAERLVVRGGQLEVNVPWVVLDSFELNMNDRLYYKVLDPQGKVISGYDDLPAMPPSTSRTQLYPALAWFYHTEYRGQAIRVARLLQPINEGGIVGMAEIYIAETLQSRRWLAGQLLFSSWVSQGLLVLLTLVLAAWLLRRVLRPMRQLSALMVRREPGLLTPLPELLPWSETRLLIVAFNRYIDRLRVMISRQERFSADASHQLKTPLAVMQSTLRSLRGEKISVDEAEPVMLEQISRISQQIGYYLHRASMRSGGTLLSRELHPIAPLLDSLTSALNKVYQRKGVNISLDISPEISFVGEQNDFMEVMGNVLDNACKYCLEFVEVSVRQTTDSHLHILVEDDGPGIPPSQRRAVFDRGQRADTLRPGQGVGLSVAREIVEQYDGEIIAGESLLGGACMEVVFGRQLMEDKES